MNREEAQNILELIRPDRKDDREDPLVREALVLLAEDAELRARFEESQETDRRISAQLSSIEVPPGLKAEILAGMRAHAATKENTVPFEAPTEEPLEDPQPAQQWWQQPWVAAAACFVLVAGLAVSVRPGKSDTVAATAPETNPPALAQAAIAQAGVPSFIPFLSQQISSLGGFDQTSTNPSELLSFLASQGDPSPAILPGKLTGMQSIGCVTFHYEETEFSMICFNNQNVYHLLTAEIDDMEQAPPTTPQVYEYEGQAFRVWTEGNQVMVLTCPGSSDKLDDII